jgi:rubrerythrin
VQLGTFGAICKYAIEIEDAAGRFYDSLAAKVPEGQKALLCEFADASRKNKQMLERTRRMEMQEMILEAITGIDTVDYDCKFDVGSNAKEGFKNAIEVEQKASRFYADSALKLGFLGNVKKTLEKTGKGREDRAKKIQALI